MLTPTFSISTRVQDWQRRVPSPKTHALALTIGVAEAGVPTRKTARPQTLRYPQEIVFDDAYAYWRFEEADTTGVAVDQIFDDNLTGDYHAGSSIVAGLPLLPPESSTAVQLTAAGGFTATSGAPYYPATIELWAATSDNNFDIVTAATATLSTTLLVDPAGTVTVEVRDGTAALIRSATGATAIDDGAWHQLAVRDLGDDIELYVDGELDSPPGTATLGLPAGPVTVTAGDTGATVSIDELSLYVTALTSQKIWLHHAAAMGLPG